MKYLSQKKGFLGYEASVTQKSKAIIIPFGMEKTVSYGKGTKNGPKEIIKASHQVELYDEEFNCEPYKKIGIKTLRPLKINKNITKALKTLSDINSEVLKNKQFPMTLGGEHSITPGCISAFTKKFKKICILHFDAHADLRESYNGEKFSHASAIKRCLDNKNVSVVSFGIRNISKFEIPFLKRNKSRINIFWAKDKTTPNSIKSLPVFPPINDKGKNTLIRTNVVAITTKVICLAPFTDASKACSPPSILLLIFSKTTIESSTINPIANTSARNVRTLSEYPSKYII